jgi:hypothetical protein
MKKQLLFIVGVLIYQSVFSQTYTGYFYSPSNQGMHADDWFNLKPNSGAIPTNSWNIHHTDGNSLFQLTFGATNPSVFIGAQRTTDLFVNGKFGLGTQSPGNKFTLAAGAGTPRSGAFGLQLYNGNADADSKNWMIETPFSGPGNFNISQYQDAPNGGAVSRFLILPTNGYGRSADLTINASGNVGIGTTSPGASLHINTSNADVLRVQNMTGGVGNKAGIDFVTYNGTGKVARIDAIDQGGYNGDMAFYTDGDNVNNSNVVERMRITSAGNIGVGTAAPSVKFDVIGSGAANTDLRVNGRIQTGDASNFGGMWVSSTLPMFIGQTNSNSLGLYNNGWRLIADNNGNVGIGTTSPNQKLTVNGTIYGKEVKVDLNVPGPDYVFEKDYKLLSLEEIKSYIDQHKHLPEVPSAKEMEQNGINVSEMNMILLRKIEELTLHVIEQNKLINQLQQNASLDPSGKKVEELTLHIIDQKKELTSQIEEVTNRKRESDRQALIIKNLEHRLEQLEKK